MTVEVFKTNVKKHEHAKMLMMQIHKTFNDYTANFDLEDCDRILRVKSLADSVHASSIIELLRDFGFRAEVLPEIINKRSILYSIYSSSNYTE